MLKPEARYDFASILLHWLTVVLIFAQIATIWFLYSSPQGMQQRNFQLNLHLVIGGVIFLVAVVWIIKRLISKPPSYPSTVSDGQRYMALFVYFFVYACLLSLPASGYLLLEFGNPIEFLGKKLHFWVAPDAALHDLFMTMHIGLAVFLAGLVVVHLVMAFYHLLKRSGIFSRMLLSISSQAQELIVPGFSGPSRKYQQTSTNFLIFGWLGFLFQLLIAIVTILLLLFATSGEQPAPGVVSGNESGIFWAKCGVASLFLTIALFFCNTLYAKKIKNKQDTELHARKNGVLHLLRFGLLSGFAGIFISILGVGESVQLLIAKTISQPPGIAITDPSKIVRALDVFVLVSNFAIVIAHFVGIIISLWLLNRVARNF